MNNEGKENNCVFLVTCYLLMLCCIHCPKIIYNFRDITRNVEENEILYEIFRIVSRFPATFRVISRKIYNLWDSVGSGSCEYSAQRITTSYCFSSTTVSASSLRISSTRRSTWPSGSGTPS